MKTSSADYLENHVAISPTKLVRFNKSMTVGYYLYAGRYYTATKTSRRTWHLTGEYEDQPYVECNALKRRKHVLPEIFFLTQTKEGSKCRRKKNMKST